MSRSGGSETPADRTKAARKAAQQSDGIFGYKVKYVSTLAFTAAAYLVAGGIVGLSAPGFNQWYLMWFALVPLLLGIVASRNILGAFGRGTVFGLGYNLVYLNWYLQLAPLNWMGLNDWEGLGVAALAWISCALHQALIIGIIAAACKFIPLTGNYYPTNNSGKWCLPAVLMIPTMWILLEKFCNIRDWLGVPWSMIEYSQYQQIPLIQSCSLFGGTGLAFLIVAANTAIACLIAVLIRKLKWAELAPITIGTAVGQLLAVSLVISILYAWGLRLEYAANAKPAINLSIVQGNINIDMQKTTHKYTVAELLKRYLNLTADAPTGICIFTESALPTYLSQQTGLKKSLESLARSKHLDLVVGSMDKDSKGRSYNSAYGIKSDGIPLASVYHKRYLVPFGEYTPDFITRLLSMEGCPQWIRKLTNTPAGGGFTAGGKQPVVLSLTAGKIASTICSEAISPEVVAASVRAGGQLIVNLSDLAWFHKSLIGDQMLAFSVFRAVENRRYFVLAANSGPTAIVDPLGRVTVRSGSDTTTLVKGRVNFESALTPFTLMAY